MARILTFLTVFLFSYSMASAGESWRVYRTTGIGKIQVCTGVGIEMCEYEPVAVPEMIDQLRGGWAIWHEQKGEGQFMCYQDIEQGIWTKRMLMFKCTPVRKQ